MEVGWDGSGLGWKWAGMEVGWDGSGLGWKWAGMGVGWDGSVLCTWRLVFALKVRSGLTSASGPVQYCHTI